MTFAEPVTLPPPRPYGGLDIQVFVRLLDEHLREQYRQSYATLTPPVWRIEGAGGRYVRVVKVDNQTVCYAFIERETGYIYKPDGWKKPAKHARGAIHDATNGFGCCGIYGVAYLGSRR